MDIRNREGYIDPTPHKALRKIGVMREAEIERQDELRPHVPTLDGWSEAEEQELVMKWAELNRKRYPALFRLFHIPNGGYRHPAEAVHLKRLGVKSGVPDLFLPYPVGNAHGLWIEMKSLTGRPTALQREWIEWPREQGYHAYVCNGAEAAINCLKMYLDREYQPTEENERKGEYICS